GSVFIYNRYNTGKAHELEYEGYKILTSDSDSKVPASDRLKAALDKFNASYASKKSPTVLLYIANCYDELGNFDEAKKMLKKIIDEYPDPKISSLAYYKMAIMYIGKGDVNDALKTFDIIAGLKNAPL